ncbi:MAG: hydrogenase expression/formation protein HypE, partial [Candidatus Altiarchaeota archaeon]|nr:hydrogenase expression/formation protein HypE [Candidatus Altiarchaeota archaeon]
ALLSKRFDYETKIVSDAKPLLEEISSVSRKIKVAKDITRGGLAAATNEICERYNIGMRIEESDIPVKDEVRRVSEMLGVDPYHLACEGRFICIAQRENAEDVEKKLRRYNKDAAIVGDVVSGREVILQTFLGKRMLPQPMGRLVPRIC